MKTLSKFLTFAFIATLLVSCGGDDPVDYSVKDLDDIAGSYTGTCIISNTDGGVSPYTVENASVRLVRTASTTSMALETGESGLISQDILSNFKNSTDGTAITFDIKAFSFTRTNLAYINGWFSSPTWSNISAVSVTINPSNDARYVKSTKTLTFSYTAKASFKATPQGATELTLTPNIKFSYTVVRQ